MNMDSAALGIAQMVGNITHGQDVLRDRAASARAAHRASQAAVSMGELKAENGELRLYLATLISLLINKGVISVDEFAKINEAIDALDGVADGRYDGQITSNGEMDINVSNEDVTIRMLAEAVKQK